jgi:hypothetical protein
MKEQAIKTLLQQILDGQRELIEAMKELNQCLEKVESEKRDPLIPVKMLEQDHKPMDLWKNVLTGVTVSFRVKHTFRHILDTIEPSPAAKG